MLNTIDIVARFALRFVVAVLAGVFLLATAARAEVPATPVTLTNPPTGAYDMFADAVALPGATSGFVVAFTRSPATPPTHSLVLRQFNNRGGVIVGRGEVVVTPPALGKGLRPKLLLLSSTRIAVVWMSGVDVFGQLYDVPTNRMVGPQRLMGDADDLIHDIVRLADGRIALVHMRNNLSNLSDLREVVSLSIFNPQTLARVAGPTSMHGAGHRLDAWNAFDHTIVDAAGGGGYVFLRDRTNGQFMMRRFNAAGQPTGALTQVNTTRLQLGTLVELPYIEIKAERLANGNIAVVWTALEQSGTSGREVRLRVMRPNGTWIGPDVRVNVETAGSQASPDIVELANSAFSVVWVSDVNIFDRRLFARKFNASGQPSGSPLQTEQALSLSLTPDTKPVRLGDGSVAHVLSGNFDPRALIQSVKVEGFRQ